MSSGGTQIDRDLRQEVILVVEDDEPVRKLLTDALTQAHYEVLTAERRSDAIPLITLNHVDLITLDLSIGADDGLDIAQEIREISNVPIIIITGRGHPLDRLAGLEQGADDYIVKPFHIKEALIRIKKVLERYSRELSIVRDRGSSGRNEPHKAYGCSLDYQRRRLSNNSGVTIDLTETEASLLRIFLDNPDRILSRNEMWLSLRNLEHDPRDRTLDGHVTHLRAKLKIAGCAHLIVKSVRGIGYVLAVDEMPPSD